MPKSTFPQLEPLRSLQCDLLLPCTFFLCIFKKHNYVVRWKKLLIRLCWVWKVNFTSKVFGRVGGSVFSESIVRFQAQSEKGNLGL